MRLVNYDFPCLGCDKLVCELGQRLCETCEFGHIARDCPQGIEVSTYSEIAYIHGDCKEENA